MTEFEQELLAELRKNYEVLTEHVSGQWANMSTEVMRAYGYTICVLVTMQDRSIVPFSDVVDICRAAHFELDTILEDDE